MCGDEMKSVKIKTEYITLGQLMKLQRISMSGGETKALLATLEIKVNGEYENRRGKKLRSGDVIYIEDHGAYVIE